MQGVILGGLVGNKRLNSKGRTRRASPETAVVKTYPIMPSGFLRQYSGIMQPSPGITASTTPANASCSEDLSV
jgi:hypothetical protein